MLKGVIKSFVTELHPNEELPNNFGFGLNVFNDCPRQPIPFRREWRDYTGFWPRSLEAFAPGRTVFLHEKKGHFDNFVADLSGSKVSKLKRDTNRLHNLPVDRKPCWLAMHALNAKRALQSRAVQKHKKLVDSPYHCPKSEDGRRN